MVGPTGSSLAAADYRDPPCTTWPPPTTWPGHRCWGPSKNSPADLNCRFRLSAPPPPRQAACTVTAAAPCPRRLEPHRQPRSAHPRRSADGRQPDRNPAPPHHCSRRSRAARQHRPRPELAACLRNTPIQDSSVLPLIARIISGVAEDEGLFAVEPAAARPAGRAPVVKTFRRFEPDQVLLMPPSLADWLPQGHLARFVYP